MSHKFFQNRECDFFPCHKVKDTAHFNCLFCYCPLYFIDDCGGKYAILDNGIKDCSKCLVPHGKKSLEIMQAKIKKTKWE